MIYKDADQVQKGKIRRQNSYRPENEFQPKLAGIYRNARNWLKMGRNLIRGGMEGITIPFYTPVRDIPAGRERNP